MRRILLIGALSAGLLMPGTMAAYASVPSAGPAPVTVHLQLTNDPDSGFCGTWANDDLLRTFTVTSLGGGEYAVSTTDYGWWYSIQGAIAPLNPTCNPSQVMRGEAGQMYGADTFTVEATGPASQANLDANLPVKNGYLDGSFTDFAGTVLALFPPGASFAPGGEFTTWSDRYQLMLPGGKGELQVQANTGYSDTTPYKFTYGG